MTTEPPLFHLDDGSPVHRGEVLHVAPEYLGPAGATCTAEFRCEGGDNVTVRSEGGAVPTVPIWALSREPHPDTVDRDRLANALNIAPSRISRRDLEMFRAGLAAQAQPVSTNAMREELTWIASYSVDDMWHKTPAAWRTWAASVIQRAKTALAA